MFCWRRAVSTDPLSVEFGRVRWKKLQYNVTPEFFEPRSYCFGFMISGIVQKHHELTEPGMCALPKLQKSITIGLVMERVVHLAAAQSSERIESLFRQGGRGGNLYASGKPSGSFIPSSYGGALVPR